MSDGNLIEIEGLREVVTAMKEARDKLPPELQVMAAEATLPILEAVASYPAQRQPKDENVIYVRGQGTKYLRTEKTYLTSQQYGKTAHQFVRREGKDIVAGVATPATYSLYVRGDINPNGKFYDRPAWMHKGLWESLVSIVTRLKPAIVEKMNLRISQFIKKLRGL